MSNSRIMKNSDAALYSMPSLEEDMPPGGSDAVLQNAEEIQRKAYEEGFASGEKAGFAEGEQKAVILMERLEKIIREIADLREKTARELESQIVELATAIARKIIIEEINTRPEIIVTMVREAMKKMQRGGKVTIRINPALHDIFMKRKPELTGIHPDIVFEVTPNLPVTAPLVISDTEEAVTDIDSLLENISEEMKNATGGEHDGY
ncbi:MAG: hypothetical protein GXP46_06235 [Deferribacteres bacterium]|nr:hypothetical protein [Deferribacteres bacterium]